MRAIRFLPALLVLGAVPGLRAQAISFTMISNGAWENPANWSPAEVPQDQGAIVANVFIPAGRTIDMSASATIHDFVTGGSVTFNNVAGQMLTVTGDFSHAAGDLVIQGSLALVLQGSSSIGSTLELRNGAGVQNDGDLVVHTGTQANGFFDSTPGSPAPRFAGGYSLVNNGTATLLGSGDVNLANIAIQNSGQVDIALSGGAKLLAGQYDQTGGGVTRVAVGAILEANSLNLSSGSVFGTGTYRGSNFVLGTGSAGAFVSPGLGAGTTGTLTLQGNLNGMAGATLHFDLGGTVQGVDYDLLSLGGNVNFTGVTFSFDFVNGFTPGLADSFTVATTSGMFNGMFDNVVGGQVTMDDLGTFDLTVTSNTVVLNHFTAVPEPGTWAAIAGSAVLGLAVWRRRTVFGLG